MAEKKPAKIEAELTLTLSHEEAQWLHEAVTYYHMDLDVKVQPLKVQLSNAVKQMQSVEGRNVTS